MLLQDFELKDVHSISNEEKEKIMDFLQGAVYCWCKNRKGEWFALRDLVGGDNYYWEHTPVIVLYNQCQDAAIAAQRAGWLLKRVIHDDKRTFETKVEAMTRQYRWIGEENNE